MLLLTPVAIRVAWRTGFFDIPDGYKAHGKPTPYLGGAALLLSLVGGVVIFAGDPRRSLALVSGASLLWLLGTLDDRRNLHPLLRVVVESAVALGLWLAGLGWTLFGSDAADATLTVLWIVGVVNAFNLMDNMDGAAPTVAAVSASSIGLVAILSHEVWAAVFALSVAGACAAFLRFNLASPSRIFLGDGGSMPLGLVIAICAIAASERAASGAVTALAAALLFVGLPVLDTCLVIVSRRRRRVSVLTGGRDHVTHRLAAHLGSPRAVALFLAIVQGTLCCAAALAVGTSQLAAWALACLLVAAGLALLTSFLLEARRSPELERSRAVVR